MVEFENNEQAFLHALIIELKVDAAEARSQHLKNTSDLFLSGAHFAYYAVLSTIQNMMTVFEIDLEKYHLSENLDREYL